MAGALEALAEPCTVTVSGLARAVLEAERAALREASLLRLRNTVPRKMAIVTPSTPKLPQNAGLQPAQSKGAVITKALRSETIPLQPGAPSDPTRFVTNRPETRNARNEMV